MRTNWSKWTLAWWPPLELSLVCPWTPLTRSNLPAWLSWEPSDLSGLDLDSPPWPSHRFPLEILFRMLYARLCLLYYVHLLYIVTFHVIFCCLMICSAIIPIFLLNCLTTDYCQYHYLVRFHCFSFNDCLISVHYSDNGNVFQVFRSRKEVTITCNLESTNIIPYLLLAITCHFPYIELLQPREWSFTTVE